MSVPPLSPEPPPALDRHLYCLTCGYNLRGLSGDPLRCPECGNPTPASDATRHELERRIGAQKQARARVATGASLCAIAVGAAVFFLGLFAVADDVFRPMRLLPYSTCAVIWVVGALTYVFECRRLPRWLHAFAHHQAYAIPAVLGNTILVFGASISGVFCLEALDLVPCFIPLVFAGAVLVVVMLRPLRWFSKRATKALDALVEADLRRRAGGL
jgi:hypothetical protein